MNRIKIRSVRRFELTLEDGEKVEVEQIGKGRYSTAYKTGNIVYLKTSDRDSSKEMLSKMDSVHLPKIEFIGSFDSNHALYRMPLYRPLLATSEKIAWAQFNQLKKMWEEAGKTARKVTPYGDTPGAWAYAINASFDNLVRDSDLPKSLKDAVSELEVHCQNYGAIQIEIAKRNCAVDEDGNLILLDPCFDREDIEEQCSRQMRKHRGY